MKKFKIAAALSTAFAILTYAFGILGIVMIVLIFAIPDAMFIGVQGLSINSGDLSVEDRIIVSCFVAVTIFLSVISARYLSGLFKSVGEALPLGKRMRQFENGGYIAMAWAVYSIGEKISLPFFAMMSGTDGVVRPHFSESTILLFSGLAIVVVCAMIRKREC
ncbi:MAG TPA: hypothetical protein ENN07_02620 [candidate division Zixibacteria bacterium]|nr:hypothetical protein [candidate division Zixibacteria bacterium]